MQAAPCPSPPTDADIATILKEQAPDGSWSATDDERGVMRDANGKKQKPAGGVIYSLDFTQNVKALSAWLKAKGGLK